MYDQRDLKNLELSLGIYWFNKIIESSFRPPGKDFVNNMTALTGVSAVGKLYWYNMTPVTHSLL